MAIAGSVRSLRAVRHRCGSSAPRSTRSHPAKTGPVGTATPGFTSRIAAPARPRSTGDKISPFPIPASVSLKTQAGTSAPSGAAMAASRSSGQSSCQNQLSRRSVAAASADPPPSPAATGIHLSSVSAALAGQPPAKASARAARRTRLSPSPTAAVNGPSTVRLSPSPTRTRIVSPKSVNAKSVSRS